MLDRHAIKIANYRKASTEEQLSSIGAIRKIHQEDLRLTPEVLKKETFRDKELSHIVRWTEKGWPHTIGEMGIEIKLFYDKKRGIIHSRRSLALAGRLVIPKKL